MSDKWEDKEDQWSAAIKAVHPVNNDVHHHYATAMKMVGNRHSKSALVQLVNWLLVERAKAEASREEFAYACLENMGIDTSCGVCMCVAFTGASHSNNHTCKDAKRT